MMGAGLTLYSTVFLYTFLANAFFLVRLLFSSPYLSILISIRLSFQLRSLRSVVLPDAINSSGTVNPSQRKKRITFLFLEAVTQLVYMGILVRI